MRIINVNNGISSQKNQLSCKKQPAFGTLHCDCHVIKAVAALGQEFADGFAIHAPNLNKFRLDGAPVDFFVTKEASGNEALISTTVKGHSAVDKSVIKKGLTMDSFVKAITDTVEEIKTRKSFISANTNSERGAITAQTKSRKHHYSPVMSHNNRKSTRR